MASRRPKADVVMDGHVVAGFEAARFGTPADECPHDRHSDEREAWLRGHDKGSRERRGAELFEIGFDDAMYGTGSPVTGGLSDAETASYMRGWNEASEALNVLEAA